MAGVSVDAAVRPGCVVLAYGPVDSYLGPVGRLLEAGIPPGSITVVHNPAGADDPPLTAPAGVEVVRSPRNLGYAGGMNLGVARHLSRGRSHVLLLTHDVRLSAGSVDTLLRAAAAHPEYAILGPAVHWDGRPFAYGGTLDRRGSWSLRLQAPAPAWAEADVFDADWVEGSAMLVSAVAFGRLGPLEERFFMYFEEAEFCLRAARAGLKIGVVPAAVADQDPGFTERPATYSYLMARNAMEYARRAAGVRGLGSALERQLSKSRLAVRAALGARSTAEQRRHARLRLLGIWTGVLAFVLRRWGPPPQAMRLREERPLRPGRAG